MVTVPLPVFPGVDELLGLIFANLLVAAAVNRLPSRVPQQRLRRRPITLVPPGRLQRVQHGPDDRYDDQNDGEHRTERRPARLCVVKEPDAFLRRRRHRHPHRVGPAEREGSDGHAGSIPVAR